MAKLETLSKEAYDALTSDEVKALYVETKEGTYELDGIGELKRALEAEKKRTTDVVKAATEKAVAEALKPFEGVDLEAAKRAIADAAKAADDKLKASGDVEAVNKAWEDRVTALEMKHKTELEAVTGERAADHTVLKREKLENELTRRGVLPTRVKFLVSELEPQTELVKSTNGRGFDIRTIGGIGDATEFDTMIDALRASPETDYFFAPDNATGGGASGSDGKGGQGTPKTLTKAQVEELRGTPAHKEFFASGGTYSD